MINGTFLLINGWEGVMGTCSYCGSRFPLTRSTRKYCTPRCKTNACLDRNPSRIRAADVRELYTLLEEDFSTVDTLRERLRRIIAPERPPIPQVTFGEEQDGVYVPKMD
ncbi:MAG: hypothetical protein DMF58_09120 [Acidobacteria bacterium]|nr:MAG: hypothetical protein DMF58_09120 [Acidobacteriota bacterium]